MPARTPPVSSAGIDAPSSAGARRPPASGPQSFVLALALAAALGLAACGSGLYDDSGQPAPGQWWPWVCADGGPAPDSGCLAPPACDGGSGDGGIDGGC